MVQIAGWGIDTVEGITYDNCDWCFHDALNTLDREPRFTLDGDGSVVVPSAVVMEAERYYVRLDKYNDDNIDREHASILEVGPLQSFIKNLIQNKDDVTEFITKAKPVAPDTDDRLRFSMHSPVSIDLYTKDGLHTGFISGSKNPKTRFVEAEISNSYITEFGEGIYLGVPTKKDITVQLNGLDYGTFTLEITEVQGGEEVETISYQNIPVTPEMQATMQIQSLDQRSALAIDMNGDGTADFSLEDGNESLDPLQYLKLIQQSISSMDLHHGVKQSTEAHLRHLERLLERSERIEEKQNNRWNTLHDTFLTKRINRSIDRLIQKIENFEKHTRFPEKEASVLIRELKILSGLVVE